MPYYVIIRGPLGVGKTTVSKILAKKLNAQHISIDSILAEKKLDTVIEKSIPVKNFVVANQIVAAKTQAAMKSGKNAIIDGNFYYRKQLIDLVEKAGRNNFVFTIKAPVAVCVERDNGRKEKHGPEAARTVHKLVSEFDYGTIVDASKKTPEQVATEIASHLR